MQRSKADDVINGPEQTDSLLHVLQRGAPLFFAHSGGGALCPASSPASGHASSSVRHVRVSLLIRRPPLAIATPVRPGEVCGVFLWT
jgi:hypothetical protein